MKFKSIFDGFDFLLEENLLYTLLKNRGIEDPKRFLHLDEKVVHDGMKLKDMKIGLETLNKHIVNNNKIHVQVDSDTDGLSSAAFIIKYIKKVSPNARVTYTLHTGKEHGIVLDLLDNIEFNLLIVPDAGTNDVKQSKILKNRNIDVLILDHHDIEKTNKYATVINCKDGEYPNQTLSGCGVVYKFCKEYDHMFKHDHADSFSELVSLGMIADAMNLKNYETRYLVLKGLEKFPTGNTFLQAIIKKNEYQIQDKVNITKVGWNIAPYINAVIRTGTKEEKFNMFRALLEEEDTIEHTSRKSKKNPEPKPVELSLQEFMANEIVRIKGRQDTAIKKGVAELNEKIVEKKLDENKILMVDGTDILDKTYTGLVANKLANQYKRPTLLLRKSYGDTYGGSGRNYSLSPVVDFRELLQGLGTFNWIMGHSNAFGYSIDADNLIPTRDKINELLKDMEITDIYKVDYEIPVNKLKVNHVKEVAEWEDLWGGGLDEPLFAITNIYIPTDKIQLVGGKGNLIRFESKGITFIKKFASEEEYNKMILKQTRGLSKKKVKSVRIDVIGKFKANEWEDKVFHQVEIIDFNSVSSNDFIF